MMGFATDVLGVHGYGVERRDGRWLGRSWLPESLEQCIIFAWLEDAAVVVYMLTMMEKSREALDIDLMLVSR